VVFPFLLQVHETTTMMVLWSGRDILIPGSNQKNKERLGYDDGSKAKVYYRTSKTNGILHGTWEGSSLVLLDRIYTIPQAYHQHHQNLHEN
jgi:hypothetical protein